MSRYFIKNNMDYIVKEHKPGVGEFMINPGEEIEINDVMDVIDTPIKVKIPYLRYPAKQIAEAIVNDFGRSDGLILIVREDK